VYPLKCFLSLCGGGEEDNLHPEREYLKITYLMKELVSRIY
jgi:hypothetical protein